jgi:catechol 2,3-dioxygenase-like lactoylglutathione lyase family enzyme
LSVTLLPTSILRAQTQAPPLEGIAHAAIRVSDLARSRDFYQKLGFEEAFTMSQGGTPTEAFLKINDRQFIELYPQRQPSEQLGFMHVCFESTDLENLNLYYKDAGLIPTPVKRAGAGNLLFTMQGPEQQNIEYTQYMPGSRHWLDRAKHLGPHRISQRIEGLGIEMQDPTTAQMFYERRLGFRTSDSHLLPGQTALEIPGASGESVEIVPRVQGSAFVLILSVTNFGRTVAQLKALRLAFEKHKSTLSIVDPDGNRIVFTKFKPG